MHGPEDASERVGRMPTMLSLLRTDRDNIRMCTDGSSVSPLSLWVELEIHGNRDEVASAVADEDDGNLLLALQPQRHAGRHSVVVVVVVIRLPPKKDTTVGAEDTLRGEQSRKAVEMDRVAKNTPDDDDDDEGNAEQQQPCDGDDDDEDARKRRNHRWVDDVATSLDEMPPAQWSRQSSGVVVVVVG